MPTRRWPSSIPLLLGVLLLSNPSPSWAGGLFMPGHGVRAMGRGGAFTAGGNDPSGIWYNPANIGGLEGIQVLVDAALVFLRMDYQRVDSGGNLLPTVSNEGTPIPLPTLAFSTNVWKQRLFVGASIAPPYSPLPAYPEPSYGACADPAAPSHCIDTAHIDSPQRYTLINLDGTLFLQLDLAVAYQVLPELVVGASVQNLFASFVALNSITSYNGALSSGPEDPDFDSLSQMKLVDLFNPSAKFGAIWRPHRMLTLGTSLQLPFWIGGDATVKVQLPVSPVYEKSTVEGDTAEVTATFPLVLRVGAQLQPLRGLSVELGFDWERWSMLQAIEIKPKDIYILNIPSIDRYKVPDLEMALGFRDTFTVRLGGEYTLSQLPLTLRLGGIFERGAVDPKYASVMAMDSNKFLLTLGLGYSISGYRMDLFYAHVFSPERVVDFRDSNSMQINPINPTGAVAVGGGRYTAAIDMFGFGASKAF
jgi:long-chain fatty acid transport protein